MAAAAIANGSVPPDELTSGESISVRVSVDSDGSWDSLDWHEVKPSMRGRYMFRTTVQHDKIRAIAIDFGRDPGVVRVDWIRMIFSVANAEPMDIRFDALPAFKGLLLRNGIAMGDNLLLGHREGPRLSWRCPPAWSERPYQVELELAFGWLPYVPRESSPRTKGEAVHQLGRRAAVRAQTIWSSRQDAHGRHRQGP
jgi:hypothetical protein